METYPIGLNDQESPSEALAINGQAVSTEKPFITANTIESSLEEIRERHIIPVFVKDNEPVISQAEFIQTVYEVAHSMYPRETILSPSVRLSHEIKGRVPEAKEKPAKSLLEHEKTIYYERMAFVIEIPSIQQEVGGNLLSLTVGGIKAYNLDNLYNKKGADEHFKVFTGFQNKVCTNLCVWTDGYLSDLKVKNLGQLQVSVKQLIESYNADNQLQALSRLSEYALTEQQFAHLIGRCRMYQHLPQAQKSSLTPLLLSDTQLGAVVKDFYRDQSFCKDADGNINLWKLYNLFTGVNKSSYIDTFLDRNVSAFDFTLQLCEALESNADNWYLP